MCIQGAHNLCSAFVKGQAYKDAIHGPEGDLFTPGISHICGKIATNEDISKVIYCLFYAFMFPLFEAS